MPKFVHHTLLLTDGRVPTVADEAPGVRLVSLPEIPAVEADAELFGPWSDQAPNEFRRAKAAFLLSASQESLRGAGHFFAEARSALLAAVTGLEGWAVDVLKLWPFPFSDADQLPEDPLPEDIFSVGFYDKGSGRFRAETFGLAKLEQAEISFEFAGPDLLDEAALLCAHLADYGMSQSRRAEHGQEMTFGFDRIGFYAPADGGEGSRRRWHPPFIQRALPPGVFSGVGLLEVKGFRPGEGQASADLTDLLRRSFEQRLELERHSVAGESPHETSLGRVCECAGGKNGLRGFRVDPETVRDSGWVFTCTSRPHPPEDLPQASLGEVARRLPQVVRYLALPPGTTLAWQGREVEVDTHQVPVEDDEPGGML